MTGLPDTSLFSKLLGVDLLDEVLSESCDLSEPAFWDLEGAADGGLLTCSGCTLSCACTMEELCDLHKMLTKYYDNAHDNFE